MELFLATELGLHAENLFFNACFYYHPNLKIICFVVLIWSNALFYKKNNKKEIHCLKTILKQSICRSPD